MSRKSFFLLMLAIIGLATISGYASTQSPQDAIALAKSTLEERVGIPADTIRFAYATAAEWPDSGLGCPEKGMSYRPVLTPGYIVSLQIDDHTYIVHVAGTTAIMCNRAAGQGQQSRTARMEQASKLLNAAREELAEKLNVQPTQIKITAIEAKTWPDASLGCPQPGTQYTQIETPGLVIDLELGGSNYRYHTSLEEVMLCEAAAASGDNG